jgi:hypothetical protein
MKTKQLANVLIKLLGLSVAIHSIPNVVSMLYSAFGNAARFRPLGESENWWIYPLSSLIVPAIGIYLIVRSRNVAECLFKDEDPQSQTEPLPRI